MVNKPGTKTIVIEQDTYDKLKECKVVEREAFDSVIKRLFYEIDKLKKDIKELKKKK